MISLLLKTSKKSVNLDTCDILSYPALFTVIVAF